ncbi:MAG: hypothetical protein ABF449_09360 [Ethanoligenens sp.]
MSWIEQTRSILSVLKSSANISYYWKRCEAPADQLPDQFIVYFAVDDPGTSWADGKETSHQTRVQVSFFFRNKADYLTIPAQIEAAFLSGCGFTRAGENDLPYQEDTGHYGWCLDMYYYEHR